MEEVWKDIYYTDSITGELIDYRGKYQASNRSRIKSLNFRNTGKEKIMNQTFNKITGYNYVSLLKNGKYKNHTVHRIISHLFIPNPNNLPYINHKDEDKTNNRVENLEWCDSQYNNSYGTKTGRISKKLKGNKCAAKPVLQYTLDGIYLNDYPSIVEAAEENICNHQLITKCCKHKRNKTGGYRWEYL